MLESNDPTDLERKTAALYWTVGSWLENFSKESAHQQARLLARSIRRKTDAPASRSSCGGVKLTRDDISKAVEEHVEQIEHRRLAHGNLSAQQAISMTKRLVRELMVTSLPRKEAHQHEMIQWDGPRQIVLKEELDTNNACFRMDIYLGEDSPEMRVKSRLIDNFISQPFYEEMRTASNWGTSWERPPIEMKISTTWFSSFNRARTTLLSSVKGHGLFSQTGRNLGATSRSRV